MPTSLLRAALAPDRADERTVIFVHVPKTGGKTLSSIAWRNYRPKQVYSITPDAPVASITAFKALPQEQRAAVRLVRGHTWYGFHTLIPGSSTYITLLRDPVERVVSLYTYLRTTPDHALFPLITGDDIDLHTFVERRLWGPLTCNGQTQFISGVYGEPLDNDDRDALEKAKQNIEQAFSVVGVTERFDETVVLLQQALGWRFPYYVRVNVTPEAERAAAPLDAATRALIAESNGLDIELYAFAKARLDALLAAQPTSFARALTRFRRRNHWFGRTYPLTQPLAHALNRTSAT